MISEYFCTCWGRCKFTSILSDKNPGTYNSANVCVMLLLSKMVNEKVWTIDCPVNIYTFLYPVYMYNFTFGHRYIKFHMVRPLIGFVKFGLVWFVEWFSETCASFLVTWQLSMRSNDCHYPCSSFFFQTVRVGGIKEFYVSGRHNLHSNLLRSSSLYTVHTQNQNKHALDPKWSTSSLQLFILVVGIVYYNLFPCVAIELNFCQVLASEEFYPVDRKFDLTYERFSYLLLAENEVNKWK